MPKTAPTRPLVTVRPVKHERYRFRLTWREGRNRLSAYARSKADAADKARDIEKRLAREGAAHDALSDGERHGVYRWRELAHRHGIPPEVTLSAVVEDYAARWCQRNQSAALQVVVDAYLAHREAERKSQRHLDDLRGRLRALMAHLEPGTTVAEVEPETIDEWLQSIRGSTQTRLNYRRVAHALFNYAVQRRFCESNPVAFSIRPTPPARQPGILTVEQLRAALFAMLEAGRFDLLPGVVLGAFVGLRTSERMGARWEHIHLDDPQPYAKVAEGKTGQRNVPLSEAAVAWLAVCRQPAGPIFPCDESAWLKRLATFRKKHNLGDWPHNCLRHSCPSYRLAQGENTAVVADEMGHSVGVLKRRYHRLVPPAEAAAWFAIRPPDGERRVIPFTA